MDNSSHLIIAVDDDYDFLEILKSILTSAGYRVAAFLDPMDALQAMSKEKPSLVITDLIMKSLDTGLTFARQIRWDRRLKDLPIIVITSAATKKGLSLKPISDKEMEKMGLEGFFDKPIEPQKLLAKVAEILGRREEGQKA